MLISALRTLNNLVLAYESYHTLRLLSVFGDYDSMILKSVNTSAGYLDL
jgi:hypothetical protein